MIEGVDYSFGRPSIAALKAAGKHFACRYLSGGSSSKDITFGEAHQLMAAGIAVVLVWEGGANRALGGVVSGTFDAHAALAQARALGVPDTVPIYFAVDFDPTGHLGAIEQYFSGVSKVLGVARTGIYGGLKAVQGVLDMHLAKYAWQAQGWSYGKWDYRAQLQQYGGTTIGGAAVDLDRATVPNYGGWGAPVVHEDPAVNGEPLVATQAEIAAIADEVWTRYEYKGQNLATTLEVMADQIAKIAAKVGAV